jgi:hypothetical protein
MTTEAPMNPDSTHQTHSGKQAPGLPRLVLEVRMWLGPDATPEQVTDEVRIRGILTVTVEEVRQLWDEGHLPVE